MTRTAVRSGMICAGGLILAMAAWGQKGWYEKHKDLPPSLDQYGPLDWADPDRSEPDGTHYKIFHSKTIHADVSYLIYFPPDYERESGARYPVLYYLHGSGGTPAATAEVARRVDKAIRAGRIAPMIVILVNGLHGDTMYCDTPDGHYPLETVIMKELIPHVDGAYRTIASREGRAIAGFSMGGFGAAHLGFKYPEMFAVISIEAPTLLGPNLQGTAPAEAWRRLFPTALGGSMDYFRANDPFTLAVRNADALRDRTFIRIETHLTPGEWNSSQCEALHRVLMEHLVQHEFCFMANVKTHNRVLVMDSVGDAEFTFFSSSLTKGHVHVPAGAK